MGNRRFRCPRPVNRLVMMRQKGFSGPFFQNTGPACIKGPGNYYAPGMPGSGPQAYIGVVLDATSIQVSFTQCVSHPGATTGIQYQIDGGVWTNVSTATKISDTIWDYTVTGPIEAGDVVRWRYVGGSGTIVDCNEAEDIGDQEIPVDNPLVLAGDFILLETGGSDIFLLEDDTDGSTGIQLENAT